MMKEIAGKAIALIIACSMLGCGDNATSAGQRAEAEGGLEEEATIGLKSTAVTDSPQIEAWMAEAAIAMERQDYATARSKYQEVLKFNGNNLTALMQLAHLDLIQGDEAAMTAHIQKAITEHPDAIEPKLALTRFYLTKGDLEGASTIVSGFTEAQKNLPEVLTVLTSTQLAQKDYPAALISLEKLVKIQPAESQQYFLLAKTYAVLGNHAKTRQALEKFVELDPGNVPGRVALARLLENQESIDEFAEQVDALREIQPDHPDVLMLRASLANKMGHQQDALELAKTAYTRAPTRKAMLLIVRQQWLLQDHEGATATLSDWLETHPEDIISRLALGDMYSADKSIDKAVEQYAAVLALDGNNVAALNNLAWHLRDSQPAQALSYASKASTINPDSADILDTLAVVQLEIGQLGDAQKTIERALAISPENPRLRYHSAMIKQQAGNKTGAIEILEPLLKSGEGFAERKDAAELLKNLKK